MNTTENNSKLTQEVEKRSSGKSPVGRARAWLDKFGAKKQAIAIGVCLLVVLAAATIFSRKEKPADKPAEADSLAAVLAGPRPVRVVKVELAARVEDRSFPAVVKAVEKTMLSFRIGGPLIDVNVKPGDAVKRGQVLMQVDPRDFRDRIQVLDANLARMSAQHRKAALDFERAKTLFSESVIPQSNYDSAQSAYDETAAAVKDIEAQLQIAKHQLADTSLLAPYDGIVTKQRAENHEMIGVGQVVLEMHDISQLEIEVDVPENEIAKHQLQLGEPAKIQFPSAPGREYRAVLKEWNTSAEPVTRTYTLVFVMEAPADATVLPGMTAQAKWISMASAEPVVAIPARSVLADAQGRSFVWVWDSHASRAQKRYVETGRLINSQQSEIVRGLQAGEYIVDDGAGFITEDQTIQPLNDETIPASSVSEASRS